MNNIIIRKGKGVFIQDITHNRYYELDKNTNILGHSYKKLTTAVKNNISSAWNLFGNTIYHKRFKKLISNIFSNDYSLKVCFSLEEFFLKLYLFSIKFSFSFEIYYDNFNSWLKEHCSHIYENKDNYNKKIAVYDMAALFLKSNGSIGSFNNLKKEIKRSDVTILNYYWHPYIDINTDSADMIILPEIFSGNFKYISILVNNKSREDFNFFNESDNIPSVYISSSLKQYFLIKKMEKNDIIKLNWNNFIQSGRLFAFKDPDSSGYNSVVQKMFEKKVILNSKPPYYNYLPINLLEHQKNNLVRIKT